MWLRRHLGHCVTAVLFPAMLSASSKAGSSVMSCHVENCTSLVIGYLNATCTSIGFCVSLNLANNEDLTHVTPQLEWPIHKNRIKINVWPSWPLSTNDYNNIFRLTLHLCFSHGSCHPYTREHLQERYSFVFILNIKGFSYERNAI